MTDDINPTTDGTRRISPDDDEIHAKAKEIVESSDHDMQTLSDQVVRRFIRDNADAEAYHKLTNGELETIVAATRRRLMTVVEEYQNDIKYATESTVTVYDEIGRFLDDAKETVTQDRSDTHGHVHRNMESTARLWNAYIWAKTGTDPGLDGVDIALLMDLAKTSRAAAGSRDRDHFEDKNGYTSIAGGLEFSDDSNPGS